MQTETAFRLPTKTEFNELFSVEFPSDKKSALALIHAIFDDTHHMFWTSSTSPADPNAGVYVDFENGKAATGHKLMARHIRLVRQGGHSGLWQEGEDLAARFTLDTSGTFVLDGLTGLEWKTGEEHDKFTWDQAVKRFR